MTHPYDKVYLSEVIEEQGKFFERNRSVNSTS